MRDFKYRNLVSGDDVWEPLMKRILEVRSKCLAGCTQAFQANMKRSAAFAVMPAAIAFQVRRDTVYLVNALCSVTSKNQITLDEILSVSSVAPSSEVKARIGLQIEQFFADSAKHDTYFDRLGLQFIEALLTFVPEGTTTSMQDSMDAVFSAIVLDSWTAFETLAGDLWTAAVDNEEGEVAARLVAAASARNLKRPDDNVRPETIYKAGLNPKKQFGSFLRAIESVSFQKLHDIKTFYELAFGKQVLRLFDESDNGYIDALAAFRNVLTHSALRADKKFIDRIRRFPEFNYINEGDLILLDGSLVNRLNMVAVNLGLALIEHIDGILTPAPTP